MREILFRGQTRRKGEKVRLDGTPVDGNWVYGGVAQFNEERAIIYQTEPEFHKFPVYADTVGQYTGLTDKNGVRVFEGDIVRCKQEKKEDICVVIWFNGAFVACPISGNLLEMTLHDYWYNDYDLIEVIGNETDNPELLKGE